MRVKKLKLKQFRNYDALELTLDPGVNLFFGPNGSGKTNLLEAVHYCALGRSHRTAQDREVTSSIQPMTNRYRKLWTWAPAALPWKSGTGFTTWR